MKTFYSLLSTLALLMAVSVHGQAPDDPTPEDVFDHWSAPDELDVMSAPTALTSVPTASDGVVEEPTPSPASVLVPTTSSSSPPADQSAEAPTGSGNASANTGGFGAGPSVAIALGGTVLIASALFLGRRRMAAENAESNSQSLGQSADADTL